MVGVFYAKHYIEIQKLDWGPDNIQYTTHHIHKYFHNFTTILHDDWNFMQWVPTMGKIPITCSNNDASGNYVNSATRKTNMVMFVQIPF